jgi:cyanophycin synthetase
MAKLNVQLTLDDSRRLTGKNLLWDKPGAIIDAFVSGISKQEVVDLWSANVRRLLIALNWQNESSCYRIFEDGISIAISAPMDLLYAACEINEAAWDLTCADLLADKTTLNFQLIVTRIEGLINEEINPGLINLMALAKQHNAFCLLDDDEFSLGYGASAETWPVAQLPLVEEIDWQKYKSIPLALVTGTNGKSTTVRIMSHIVKESGKCCGVTSTDFIRVGDEILDYGDYSGPGGARM